MSVESTQSCPDGCTYNRDIRKCVCPTKCTSPCRYDRHNFTCVCPPAEGAGTTVLKAGTEKTTFNSDYLLEIIKYAFVTAVGYMSWQIYTTHRKRDWSSKWSYAELFLVVFVALVVANLAFTLIFQRDKLWTPAVKHTKAIAINPQTQESSLLHIYSN